MFGKCYTQKQITFENNESTEHNRCNLKRKNRSKSESNRFTALRKKANGKFGVHVKIMNFCA